MTPAVPEGKGGAAAEAGGGLAFLAALQLADSFFPTGLYAHSQGLEAMAARGRVRSAGGVRRYLAGLLEWSVLPSDGAALLAVHAAASEGRLEEAAAVDRRLDAMKLPSELRAASRSTGRRLLEEAASAGLAGGGGRAGRFFDGYRRMVEAGQAPGSAAAAMGAAACAVGVPPQEALGVFCHGWAAGLLGASQRLLGVTHAEAQQILRSLAVQISESGARSAGRGGRGMTSFAPWADIASMLHEEDDVRMFAS